MKGNILTSSETTAQRLLAKTADWPDSWRYEQTDIATGNVLLAVFLPFLQHLVLSGLSSTSLRKHFTNIWLLGGEMIRRVQRDQNLRKTPAFQIIMQFIDDEGGPISKDISAEQEQRSFDSTSRKLYHFLSSLPPQ